MANRSFIRSSYSGKPGKSRPSMPWLPTALRDQVLGNVAAICGGGVMLLGLLLLLALASYTPSDPSWNTAQHQVSELGTNNWLGLFGSYSADLLIQFFGVASYLLCIIIAAWGWRIAQGRSLDHISGRFITTIIALLALATCLHALFPQPADSLQRAAGGAFGLLLGSRLTELLPASWGDYALGAGALVIAFMAAYMACALTISEWAAAIDGLRRAAMRVYQAMMTLFTFIQNLARRDQDQIEREEEEIFVPQQKNAEVDEPEPAPESKPKPRKAPMVRRPAASARQAKLLLRDDSETPLPPLELLHLPDSAMRPREVSEEALERNAKMLENVLADFGVSGVIGKVSPGPVVTLYELEPAPGIRAARVIALADDIARSMSAASVRVAVVPGRNVIGIELPNQQREVVYLRELLMSEAFVDTQASLPLILGKDIAGQPIIADLSRMPHLLVAGTTGSGKSVSINTMLLSLLYRLPPQKCRFIMVDPKMLELSVYEGIPHLLAPVVTEPKKAIVALKWTVREMEERYRAMSKLGVRNIEGYNMRLKQARDRDEKLMRQVQTGYDPATGKPIIEEQPLDLTELPYIVVIVDEMADLMLVAGKEIEIAVQRLAQMARAAGIHLIMATQRPSVDVITGTIKANFPTRISFQVTSKIDSRTILGEQGAEQLLGQGDMLYMAGGGRITRVHGPFVRDSEVEAIVGFLKAQGEPEYLDEVTEEDESDSRLMGDSGSGGGNGGGGNEMYDRAVDLVLRERKASTSFLQRHFQIGYNKAATLIERMEKEGVISPANHVGKREIYGRDPGEDFN
jgi:DNA segregation ATPase FtsK/SpoIIIE, S-DNA-T family